MRYIVALRALFCSRLHAAAAAADADLYLLAASPHIENAWSKHRGEPQCYRATTL
jgi:hypothetical protein